MKTLIVKSTVLLLVFNPFFAFGNPSKSIVPSDLTPPCKIFNTEAFLDIASTFNIFVEDKNGVKLRVHFNEDTNVFTVSNGKNPLPPKNHVILEKGGVEEHRLLLIIRDAYNAEHSEMKSEEKLTSPILVRNATIERCIKILESRTSD